MKKKLIPFIISLFIISFSSYSQIVDYAKLEILYDYKMIGNRLEPDNVMKDITMLLIGEKYMGYFSYMNYIRDSLRKANPTEYRAQVATTDGRVLTPRPGETSEELKARGGTVIIPPRSRPAGNPYNYAKCLINRILGEILCQTAVLDVTNMKINYYSYTETLKEPKWNISTDTEIIAGYNSQKATTNYGGRDWIVWFTPDIPISEGPWKLRGLPGLILKAETFDGEFSLMVTSLVRSSERPIEKCEERVYREISKKELLNLETKGAINTMRPIDFNHIEILK